jgi:hypothetical protein
VLRWPQTLKTLLSKLTKTVNWHSLFLTVMIAVLLEDRPDVKQSMIDGLNKLRKRPEYAGASGQEAIDLAIRVLQTAMPTIQ